MKLRNRIDVDVSMPGQLVVGERFVNDQSVGWYLRQTVPIEKRTNRRNPYVFTALQANSQQDALKQVRKARASGTLERSSVRKQPAMRIRNLADEWLRSLDPSKFHRSRRFRSSFKNHILPIFGELYLHELDKTSVHAWAEDRAHKGASQNTFGNDVHALRTFLKWCDRKFGLRSIDEVPNDWSHLKLVPAEPSHKFPKNIADQILTFAFQQAFKCNNPRHPQYWSSARLYGAIAFMRYTGIRVQELGGLKFEDIRIRRTTEEQRRNYVVRNKLTSQSAEAEIESAANTDEAAFWAGFNIHVGAVKHKSHKRLVTPRVEFFDDWILYIDLYRERCLRTEGPKNDRYTIDDLPPTNAIFPNSPSDLKSGGCSLSRPHRTLLSKFVNENEHAKDEEMKVVLNHLNQQCWRHTYATELLESWVEADRVPDIPMLVRNMGTSEKMLRFHYEKELDSFVPPSLSV